LRDRLSLWCPQYFSFFPVFIISFTPPHPCCISLFITPSARRVISAKRIETPLYEFLSYFLSDPLRQGGCPSFPPIFFLLAEGAPVFRMARGTRFTLRRPSTPPLNHPFIFFPDAIFQAYAVVVLFDLFFFLVLWCWKKADGLRRAQFPQIVSLSLLPKAPSGTLSCRTRTLFSLRTDRKTYWVSNQQVYRP